MTIKRGGHHIDIDNRLVTINKRRYVVDCVYNSKRSFTPKMLKIGNRNEKGTDYVYNVSMFTLKATILLKGARKGVMG